MPMKSEENSQEILELTSLYGGDIDVIVDANDLASFNESENGSRRFAVVKFRDKNVDVDKADEWKGSI